MPMSPLVYLPPGPLHLVTVSMKMAKELEDTRADKQGCWEICSMVMLTSRRPGLGVRVLGRTP